MKTLIPLIAAGCFVGMALAQQPKPGAMPGPEASVVRSSEPTTGSPPPAAYLTLPSETPDEFSPRNHE